MAKGKKKEGVVSLIAKNARKGKKLKPKKIEWWSMPFMPRNKFVILAGEGGIAKSTIMYDFIAKFTGEDLLPLSAERGGGGSVLIITDEDDAEDTIIPRVEAAGGSRNKIQILTSDNFYLDLSNTGKAMEDLHAYLEHEPDTALIIFDPIDSYIGKTSGNDTGVIKRILGSLTTFCSKRKVLGIGVLHFNKRNKSKNSLRDMVSGSASWINGVRHVLGAFRDPNDKDLRYFGIIKSNIGPTDKSLSYSVSFDQSRETLRLNYHNKIEMSLEDLFTSAYAPVQKKNGVEARVLEKMEQVIKENGGLPIHTTDAQCKVARKSSVGKDKVTKILREHYISQKTAKKWSYTAHKE